MFAQHITSKKGKAVPQHTYGGAAGERGCVAPTHSRPRH
jgi:hypothetical protein